MLTRCVISRNLLKHGHSRVCFDCTQHKCGNPSSSWIPIFMGMTGDTSMTGGTSTTGSTGMTIKVVHSAHSSKHRHSRASGNPSSSWIPIFMGMTGGMGMTIKVVHSIMLILSGLLLSTTLWASPYRSLYVFGDSLSDTDNSLISLVLPTPPYSSGRVSNGPVWVEYLAQQLDIAYNPQTNFAWAGANTGISDNFGLLPGLLTQVDFCIENYPVDSDGLYLLWIGANDLFDGVDTPETTVVNAVSNITTAIERLIAYGARNILLLNVPDLGQTPEAEGENARTALTAISFSFNQALAEQLNQLEARIVLIDMFFFIHKVIENPTAFGLQAVFEPCFLEESEQVCDDPAHYLFWDNKHPTTAAHQIVANYVFKTVALPYYDTTEKLLFLPSVNVVTQTEFVGVFEAKLRLVEDMDVLLFTLVEAQEIVAHNVFTEPVTFGLETGMLHIPLVEVGASSYRAQLVLDSETETLQNFIVTELVSR